MDSLTRKVDTHTIMANTATTPKPKKLLKAQKFKQDKPAKKIDTITNKITSTPTKTSLKTSLSMTPRRKSKKNEEDRMLEEKKKNDEVLKSALASLKPGKKPSTAQPKQQSMALVTVDDVRSSWMFLTLSLVRSNREEINYSSFYMCKKVCNTYL